MSSILCLSKSGSPGSKSARSASTRERVDLCIFWGQLGNECQNPESSLYHRWYILNVTTNSLILHLWTDGAVSLSEQGRMVTALTLEYIAVALHDLLSPFMKPPYLCL